MKKSYVFILAALLMVFTQSCGKKSDPAPSGGGTITNQDLLKTWKVSEALEGTLDITAEFTAYRITFADDGTNKTVTLTNRQGTTTTGTWAISTDNTEITLTTGGTSIKLTGVSITASQLKYTGNETGKTGQVAVSFTLTPA